MDTFNQSRQTPFLTVLELRDMVWVKQNNPGKYISKTNPNTYNAETTFSIF